MQCQSDNHTIAIVDGMVTLSLSMVDLVHSSIASGSANPMTSKKKSKRNHWASAGKSMSMGIYKGHKKIRRCKGTMMQKRGP